MPLKEINKNKKILFMYMCMLSLKVNATCVST